MMRKTISAELEKARVRFGHFGSDPTDGTMGAFFLKGPRGRMLRIISSGPPMIGYMWEHVSVSTDTRTPYWDEMCYVKDLFWEPEEACVQFHPPTSEYVNHHPFCLHIWRHINGHATPPSMLVGPTKEEIR